MDVLRELHTTHSCGIRIIRKTSFRLEKCIWFGQITWKASDDFGTWLGHHAHRNIDEDKCVTDGKKRLINSHIADYALQTCNPFFFRPSSSWLLSTESELDWLLIKEELIPRSLKSRLWNLRRDSSTCKRGQIWLDVPWSVKSSFMCTMS